MGFNTAVPILTANRGWTTIGCLSDRDVLFDVNGNHNPIKSSIDTDAEAMLEVNLSTGEKIICDKDTALCTNTSKEVHQNLKRTPAWREKRKSIRPSRAVKNPKRPNQSEAAKLSNSNRNHEYLSQITPDFRSILEIKNTLYVRGNRKNHILPLVQNLTTLNQEIAMDPYTLGVFLGDGAVISTRIIMETLDWNNIQNLIPYRLVKETITGKNMHLSTRRYEGLREHLNLLLDYTYHISPSGRRTKKFIKRIPNSIYMASFQDRLNCLKGLMDTDGTVDKRRGRCEVGFSDIDLATDTIKLLSTLGIKSSLRPKQIKGAKTHYRMQFNTHLSVFNLDRKRELQHRSPKPEYVNRRYLSKIDEVGVGFCKKLTVQNDEAGYLVGHSLTAAKQTIT
ncbi:LAGLIDADG family homing endonuclease [Planktomarina temperata]|nr:LAGLIDADG family homing endonuclease [Planktomarina temperata]MDB4201044.1 LAGLIDADG family homing endonuclease [Planktomarina temperata]MDC1192967.1 LAGLIDADG family homing endonuclease [Planktomarina temperata]